MKSDLVPTIRSVRYAGAASDPRACPLLEVPEFAFAGRSNVGKSSLLNTLLGRRRIARVSSTPGRTQLLHFYLVNEALAVTDLPGYGYAAVSKRVRASWKGLVEGYLRGRVTLRAVVLILDVRRDPGPEERDLLAWLEHVEIPAVLVATKCDKLSKSGAFGRLRALRASLGSGAAAPIGFSATTGRGKEELWKSLLETLSAVERTGLVGRSPASS